MRPGDASIAQEVSLTQDAIGVTAEQPSDDRSGGEFRPTASWAALRRRSELMIRLRALFQQAGFLEVETPVLSAETVVDRHLHPIAVQLHEQQGSLAREMWLQTSPEFAMKRLLASGAKAIFQVARAFRNDETGPLHNPEFTLVEWYRAHDSYAQGMQFLSDLADCLLERGAAESLTYGEAFLAHVGEDPHRASIDALSRAARRHRVSVPEGFGEADRDGWLDLLLSQCVMPHLGNERPLVLFDYPASQAALAQVSEGDPRVARRFELFVDGIELANGYDELRDPDELRRRNQRVNQQRTDEGNSALPTQSRLLDAMQSGLPPAVGVALGWDRLVMVALGARSLNEVMAFPISRA